MLKHNDFGEADRLLHLYTLQRGKVRALAKGVRKVQSRKAGHLEPFTRVQLQLAAGRNFYIVTQAEAGDMYPALRDDLERLGNASYVVELVDGFTYDEEENPAIFRLLTRTLTRLGEGTDPQLVLRHFELQLLDLLGFRPELHKCVERGEEIQPEDQYFSASQGGVLCPNCGRGKPGARPVSVDALKYLRHIQRSDFQEAARAKIPPGTHREIEVLMQHYVTHLLERALNSPDFLRRVRKESLG